MKSTKIEKYCQFCCYQDVDMDYEPCWYEKDNYSFYAGYCKQFDVDEFDEYETENINYCPICGRKLKEDENAER